MTLAEQIIDSGPYIPGDASPFDRWPPLRSSDFNQLRDELLELRQLKAAAGQRERFKVDALRGDEDEPDTVALFHDRPACLWEAYPDAHVTLAELVRRADQHTQDCP